MNLNVNAIRNLILISHLVAIIATVAIIQLGLSLNMPLEEAQQWGGTLSLTLIVCGAITHLGARKGQIRPTLLALMCIFGPIYAYMAGFSRHVVGYHVVAFGFHALIFWTLLKNAKRLDNENGEAAHE